MTRFLILFSGLMLSIGVYAEPVQMVLQEPPPPAMLQWTWPKAVSLAHDDGHGWRAACVQFAGEASVLKTQGSLGYGFEWQRQGAARIPCLSSEAKIDHGWQWLQGPSKTTIQKQLGLVATLPNDVVIIWEWQTSGGAAANEQIAETQRADHQVHVQLRFLAEQLQAFSLYHTATF